MMKCLLSYASYDFFSLTLTYFITKYQKEPLIFLFNTIPSVFIHSLIVLLLLFLSNLSIFVSIELMTCKKKYRSSFISSYDLAIYTLIFFSQNLISLSYHTENCDINAFCYSSQASRHFGAIFFTLPLLSPPPLSLSQEFHVAGRVYQ